MHVAPLFMAILKFDLSLKLESKLYNIICTFLFCELCKTKSRGKFNWFTVPFMDFAKPNLFPYFPPQSREPISQQPGWSQLQSRLVIGHLELWYHFLKASDSKSYPARMLWACLLQLTWTSRWWSNIVCLWLSAVRKWNSDVGLTTNTDTNTNAFVTN